MVMTEQCSQQKVSVVVRRSIIARAIISVVVVAACVVGARYSEALRFPYSGSLYVVFGVMILLSFLYVVGLRGGYDYPKRLLRLQLLLDCLVVTGIVASTGGVYSVFAFLYIIAVLEVGILLTQAESLLAASCSSMLLGAMVVLTQRGLLPPISPSGVQGGQMLYHLIVQIFALYLTAFISSYWSFRLHKIQAFQRGLFNNMSSGFLITDDSGAVRVMNVAAQRILGFSLEEAVGKRSRDVLKVPDGGADPMEATLNTGEEFSSYEFRVVRQDGKEMLVGITTNVLREARGRSEGVIASFVDLTEIERMRRELRNQDRLAAVGELAAGLAHEIRNPVAAIRGSVEELGRNLDDPSMARSLADIAIRESDQLNQLVTRFLQFAGSSRPVKQTFDLCDLLEETIVLLRRRARRARATAVEYCAGDGPAVVHMDRSQLKQALLNIGHNALEAMSEGGTLDICLAVGNGADQAEVTFRDSGVGIPQDQMERIFEPFFTTKKHGFGMGLAVVQKIISSHGGSVEISSKEREGTTVTVTVPLKETADQPVALASAS
jgi:two-component system sensor histidine kinase PilS (NtrC family)